MKLKLLLWKRAAFAVLLILLLSAVGMTNALAQTFTVGNLNYSLNNDGASVTVLGHVDGQNATGELVIPESVELYGTSYPVTVIGSSAFSGCHGLTGSLVIPNSVITIGESAFNYCYGFTGTLTLGNAVQSIGSYAFESCNGFTGTLTIPESVTSINGSAFAYCNFSILNYNATNCNYVHYSYSYPRYPWLYYCNSLTTVNIGENVQTIPNGLLCYCSSFTGELVIPESVTSIGSYAFNGCSGFTGSLVIPEAVTFIGADAFYGCSGFTGSLTIPESVTSIEAYAFYGCTGFTGSLTIGNSVTSIGTYAFNGCTGFEGSLNLGNSVTTIGEGAFYGCSGFTGSLTIPNSVSSIGVNAFSGCTSFSGTLTLGNSLTQIGNTAFFGACQGFTSFTVLAEVPPTLGNNVFVSADFGMPVYVPCGSLDAYQNASGWNVFTNIQETDPCLWAISASATPNVGGTVSGDGLYYQGQSCTLTATPLGDFEFSRWTENGVEVSINASYTFTVEGNRNLVAHFRRPNYIYFADANVEARCLELWDSDGDGNLSYEEAAAVTNLQQAFRNNDNITSFNELQYFTGLTSLNNEEFYDCNYLRSITLPEGLTSIGNAAFQYCNRLTTIVLPEGLTLIGNYAFYNCDALPSITFPESLTSMGEGAFYDCDALISITLPEGLTNIESQTFNSCNALSSITFPESLSSIGSNAFIDCDALTSIVLPEGLTTINYQTFYSCNALSSVTLPESLTTIGQSAFSYCNALSSIILPESLTSIGYQSFYNCTALSSITLPENLSSIGSYAFQSCTALSSINTLAVVPPTLGSDVFNGLNLYNVVVNVPCNTMMDYQNASGWDAFHNFQESNDCIYDITVSFSPEIAGTVTGAGSYQRGEICTLTAIPAEGRHFICWMENGEVVLQDSIYSFTVNRSRSFGAVFSALPSEIITFLDANVKAICVEHWDIDGDGELSYSEAAAVTNLGNWFQGNTDIMIFHELQYFTGLSTIPANAFRDCTLLNFITLPNNLTSIGNYAFYNCSGLIGGLTIPDSVITIGDSAFCNCSGFMGLLTIGESVQTIGNYAFYNCRNFTGSINIPNSVVTIGNYAFYGSTAYWGTLTLGNSVRTIGNYAFYGCNGLVGDLVIPNSVTSIGNYAFYDCHSFGGTLTIGNSVTTIGDYAFKDCYNLTGDLVIPNSVTSIGYEAFRNCHNFAGTLTLGTSITSIGSYAFRDCYNLVGDIFIPNSVSSIGQEAFRNCYGFTGNLTIPSSVTSIGRGAFYYCTGLSEIYYNVTSHADISEGNYTYSYPFAVCGGHLNIGNNVVMIPSNMFRYADFTGTLTIPNSVISIRDYAFYYCDQLTGTLVIPNSMNTIGVNAFQYCTGFTQVIMGINVMIVGNRSFSNCTGLQKVILPDVVTVIGIEAFRYCTQLSEVNMQAPEAPSIGWDVFSDNAPGRIITIPCGTMENYAEGYWEEWADALVEMCGDYVILAEADPTYAGSVSGGGTFSYSEICTLTATSNIGYPFHYWTRNGVVVSTEPEYSFGVTETCTYVAHFSPDPVSYDITVAANMQEAGTVTGAGSYLHGATVTLTATENEGYHFVNWAKNGHVVSTEANYSFTVTEAGNYIANFAPNSYDIIAEANPTEGGTVAGAGVYGHNSTVILTATANTGYTFINWTKDGTVVSNEPTYTFTVTESSTYVANFELNSYVITAMANPTNGGSIAGAGVYNHGETATLTAIANVGYPFINWTKEGQVVSVNPTYSFIVTEDAIYVANFSQTPVSYAITATANPTEGGTVSGAGNFGHGATATLTAIPNEHYNFVNWTKDGEVVSEDPTYSFTVTEAGDYEANFTLFSFNIEVAVNVEGTGSVNGGGTYNYGETATVTATPTLGYHFVNWKEDDIVVSTDAEYAFTVTEDRSLTASFGLDIYFIAVACNPIQGGSVSGGGAFNYGGEVVLTAVPNEGYVFVNWMENGEVISTNPTYSFIATSSRDFVVNFELTGIAQTTSFGAGWNWYSTYIEQSGIDGLSQLENSLGSNGLIIKSRSDGFAEYYDINGMTGWYGTLESISNEQMYMINTNAACNVTISGYVANPANHPITIVPGWNWVGYPSAYAMNVETAMEGFNPENNDIIKGREGFTSYYAEGGESMWFGSLNSLEPGHGYMYKSNSTESKTLTFQTGRVDEVVANITPEGNQFGSRGENYANNMTVMAVVELDGMELRSEEYELAAFAGDECRGSIRLMYVEPINRYIAFLTVFGENVETLHFRLTDGMETAFSDNEISFVADGALGTLAELYIVSFRGLTSVEDVTKVYVTVYPNPSDGIYHIEGQDIDKIEVYDAWGQLIYSKEGCNDFMSLNLTDRANGVYMLRVIAKNGVTTNRIIKK